MEQRSSPVAMAQGRGSPLMMPSRRKTASRGHRRHRPAQAENGFRLDLNLQSSEDAGTCQWGARSAGRRPERRWRGGCATPLWWSHQLAPMGKRGGTGAGGVGGGGARRAAGLGWPRCLGCRRRWKQSSPQGPRAPGRRHQPSRGHDVEGGTRTEAAATGPTEERGPLASATRRQ